MKTNAIAHILLFLLLLFAYQCASAQDYIVTTRGDSLTGEVKPLLYGTEKRVQLTDKQGEKSTYSLFEVRAFSHDGDVYHPVRGQQGYVFMKLLQPGYLSLYAFQPENQTRFDGHLLRKMDGEQMVVPNLGFRKFMTKFLEDCPEVAERIDNGELTKRDLTEVIDAYNACVEARTVDHEEIIAARHEQNTIINAWDTLEKKIGEKSFEEKSDALEMIAEIRMKIRRQESIPNFLVEGLRASLEGTGLQADLDEALEEIQ